MKAALVIFVLTASSALAQPGPLSRFDIKAPRVVLTGVPFKLELVAADAEGNAVTSYQGSPRIDGLQPLTVAFQQGRWSTDAAVVPTGGAFELRVVDGAISSATMLRAIPGILSILPPVLAIALALTVRQVVVSLFAGVWLGAYFLFDYRIVAGFFGVLDHFLIDALTEKSHVQILVFSLLFGGMVGVIGKNGGARGIARVITRYATSPRGGQVATWAMALVLFFDDYANVLVRGNLMRPITDRLRVSREKLSFLVDTGAATVASIFIISTWIGYEVGLIEQGLRLIGSTEDAYTLFIRTIPYRFYPILALILALLISVTGRDFGPMLAAERRARSTGKVLRDGAQPASEVDESAELQDDPAKARWYNGLLPIASILLVGLFGLYWTGTQSLEAEGTTSYGLGQIVSGADSYVALLWASLAGCVVAMVLSLAQRILDLNATLEAWVQGMKSMFLAVLILILAWAIGNVTAELHTADYLVQLLRGTVPPYWLPVLTFIIAAAVSFATGTSWATMAIMLPLVIPLADALSKDAGLASGPAETVLLGVVSSVLAGAVFGDHCSPISDTTILSSLSSACDHIDHVRTQLPYALVAAVVGMLVGDIPTAYGLTPWVSLAVGTLALLATLYIFGKKVGDETQAGG